MESTSCKCAIYVFFILDKLLEMCQNLQSDKNLLLAETEKLQTQYTSLIKQLDQINTAFDERRVWSRLNLHIITRAAKIND